MKITVLTGAGISAESGIQTFRSEDGLWENHRIEDVATPEGYLRNPELVQDFYNQRRHDLQQPNIKPNAAHIALAQLESHPQIDLTLVTQNIDDLHERAGSQSVIHMHGELLKVRCPESQQVIRWTDNLTQSSLCHCCQLANPLRPHVVWFGEVPLELERIYAALASSDLFIAIGTSGSVYPAAGFVQEATAAGAMTVELNLKASIIETQFKRKLYGPASQIVPHFVEETLKSLASV